MFFDDFTLNREYDIPPAIIEKEKMMDFARVYDNIPIHTDEEYAKNTHFGALIAPGVMSFMSVWVNFLSLNLFGDEIIAGKSTSMEWHKPVYAGDTLTGKAIVSKLTPRNEKNGIVEITIYIHNQHGELVLTDITQTVVKRRI